MRLLPWKRQESSNIRLPWLFRLPKVFQINSSIIFIGIMCVILGAAALLGYSDPQSITSKMSLPFYQLWGLILSGGGVALTYGILSRQDLVEKYAARILSISFTCFATWALVANGLGRAFVSVTLCSIMIFLLEQRICFINIIWNAQRVAQARTKDNDSTED